MHSSAHFERWGVQEARKGLEEGEGVVGGEVYWRGEAQPPQPPAELSKGHSSAALSVHLLRSSLRQLEGANTPTRRSRMTCAHMSMLPSPSPPFLRHRGVSLGWCAPGPRPCSNDAAEPAHQMF